jgi:hypothetical protein
MAGVPRDQTDFRELRQLKLLKHLLPDEIGLTVSKNTLLGGVWMLLMVQDLVKVSGDFHPERKFCRADRPGAAGLQFKPLLEQGSMAKILRGLLRILFTGQL